MNTAPVLKTRHRVYAVFLATLGPALLAGAFFYLVPQGCDERGNPSLYRWTCLLPGLLLTLPMLIALFLPLAGWVNGRLPRRLPDGWLATILGTGLATQLAFVGFYALALNPAYLKVFLAEALFIPQPLVTGAVTGACYTSALAWFGARHRGTGP